MIRKCMKCDNKFYSKDFNAYCEDCMNTKEYKDIMRNNPYELKYMKRESK